MFQKKYCLKLHILEMLGIFRFKFDRLIFKFQLKFVIHTNINNFKKGWNNLLFLFY